MPPKNLMLTILILFAAAIGSNAQERPRIDFAKLPKESASAEAFVPARWKIEKRVEGDLNNDSRPDIILLLIQDKPAETGEGVPNERFRAMVILLRAGNGKLQRAAGAAGLLYCTTCAGMLSAPEGENTGVMIEKGVIVVNQMSGSREMLTSTHRFRYDAPSKRFLLIGKDLVETDRATGAGVTRSFNYLTGVKITKKTRYDQKLDREISVANSRQKIARSRIFIEDVDYEKF